MAGRLICTDSIPGILQHFTGNDDYDKGYGDGVARVLKAIGNAPTVEAIPIDKAIPIDFIKKIEAMGFDYMHCAGVILGLWNQERKEQDGDDKARTTLSYSQKMS